MDNPHTLARIAVDIGGTFTDVALETTQSGERNFITAKTPTTPQDPVEGAITGVRLALDDSGIHPKQVSSFIHGTTLVLCQAWIDGYSFFNFIRASAV